MLITLIVIGFESFPVAKHTPTHTFRDRRGYNRILVTGIYKEITVMCLFPQCACCVH